MSSRRKLFCKRAVVRWRLLLLFLKTGLEQHYFSNLADGIFVLVRGENPLLLPHESASLQDVRVFHLTCQSLSDMIKGCIMRYDHRCRGALTEMADKYFSTICGLLFSLLLVISIFLFLWRQKPEQLVQHESVSLKLLVAIEA
mmetsp:Transcript_20654/g.42851  ORF Transcript_20654/g.42851 Transcript_20654/m.42851 type:complete len:143 (-) Transcript_20654:276-704(-)